MINNIIKDRKLNIAAIRDDFPILQQKIHNQPLVYLDNSATTQKPRAVIEAINHYYCYENANVHRGVHTLSDRATNAYEQARETVQKFINAKYKHEIIFVRGTTEAINLVAASYARATLQAGDEIVISAMEHHSNIVPWQMVCQQTGAKLQVIPINDQGEIHLEDYVAVLNEKTKLVAIAHISNVLGTINPVQQMIAIAHAKQIPVLLDGAQAAPHQLIDVQQLDCDFYTFSGHKLYGPTGIGILYGKEKILEKMLPYQTGGGMVQQVTFAKTSFQRLPEKFEAGTPNVAGAVGLRAAINYIHAIGMPIITEHEQQLLNYATMKLNEIKDLRIIGTAKQKAAVISFVMDHVHPHDIGTVLDSEGIAIRVGHHCAMPLMERFNLPATARVSFGVYNTFEEIDRLIESLTKVRNMFKL